MFSLCQLPGISTRGLSCLVGIWVSNTKWCILRPNSSCCILQAVQLTWKNFFYYCRPTSRYLLSDSDSDSGSAYVRQPQPTQMASPPPHQNSLLSPPQRRNSLPSLPSCRNLLPSPPPVPCGLTSPHTLTSVSGTSFLIRCTYYLACYYQFNANFAEKTEAWCYAAA